MIDQFSNFSSFIGAALAVAVLIVVRHLVRLEELRSITDELPHQLTCATLLYSERLLVIEKPTSLFGRVDQVWKRANDQLVVADTKTRELVRYYFSDRLQLTGYAFLLKYHPDTNGHSIAPYGFLRIPQDGKAVYLKVPLLSEQEYRDHIKRHQALLAGSAKPRSAKSPLICRGCGHIDRCPTPLYNHQ